VHTYFLQYTIFYLTGEQVFTYTYPRGILTKGGGMNPRERIQPIIQFYRQQKRMPSFRELATLWKVKSTNAVHKTILKLIEYEYLKKDRKTGALLPGRALTQFR